MVNDYVLQIHSSEGVTNYDMDQKTLAQIVSDGFIDGIDGKYIMHRIKLACITQQPPAMEQLYRMSKALLAGFCLWCDVHEWSYVRQMASELVDGVKFLQADYDLIDGLLPE